MKRFAFALATLLALPAAAQTNPSTPVVATQLTIGGVPVATGQVIITAVDRSGTLTSFTTADGKLYLNGTVAPPATVTNGAITGFSIPDQCTSSAITPNTPLRYRVDVIQTSNNKPTGVQATYISEPAAPFFCGSAPVAIDHFSVPQTSPVLTGTVISASVMPGKCTATQLYYAPTNPTTIRPCVNGVFANVSSSGGSSLTWSGAWSSSANYTANTSAVLRNGSSYVAIQNSTNQDPATATAYWQLLASKGADGANGTNGTNGTNGSTGPAGPAPAGTGIVKSTSGVAGLAIADADYATPSLVSAEAARATSAEASLTPGSYTVNTLPAPSASNVGKVYLVTDGVAGSACTTGGATTNAVRALCQVYLVSGSTYAYRIASQPALEKGIPNGVASLGADGLVPSTQLTAPNKRIYSLYGIGTSFTYGIGPLDNAGGGWFPYLQRKTRSVRAGNYGISGVATPQIVLQALTNVYPTYGYSIACVGDVGPNDGSINQQFYSTLISAIAATCTVPNYSGTGNQLRWRASSATNSGFAADTTIALANPPNLTSLGTMMKATASGSTLTFSITTSTKLGVNYVVTNGSTGTFTVSLDGSLLTDPCTGTTTFGTGPCGGTNMLSTSYTVVRPEFTVTAGAHTVVVTSTSATAFTFSHLDTLPPANDPNTGAYFVMNANTNYSNYANNNATLASVVAAMGPNGDGLPIFLVDQINGYGSTPGVNTTTDMSTTQTGMCSASSLANHPNDNCGARKILDLFEAVEVGNRYIFSDVNGMGTNVLVEPTFVTGSANRDAAYTWNGAKPTETDSNPGGIDVYRNLSSSNRLSFGWHTTSSAGLLPSSSTYTGAQYSAGFFGCDTYFDNATVAPFAAHLFPVRCADRYGNTFQLGIASTEMGTAVASATTITPIASVTHITGTAAISTITVPSTCTLTATKVCRITLWPDAAWTLTTSGNITNASTAIPGRPMDLWYDQTTSKWGTSY